MAAGRNSALLDTAILAFGSAGRGLPCTAVGLTAALRVGAVGLRDGGVSGAGLRWRSA